MGSKKKSLTVQELSLYIGCECMVHGRHKTHIIGIHTNGNIQVAHAVGSQDKFEVEYVKPILRPLSTMTEQEALEYLEIRFGRWGWDTDLIEINKDCIKYRYHSGRRWSKINIDAFYRLARESTIAVPFLLSKHFDLFNWISEKYALDKTKVK